MGTPWYKQLLQNLSKRLNRQASAKPPTSKDSISLDSVGDSSSTREHIFTVAELNRESAQRQASLGTGYARNSNTRTRLAQLKNSTVALPPHAPWQGDYTNWVADPYDDLNWRFQFQTLRWINPYLWDALDGNLESKAEWKRIVRSWAEQNTPPERAQDRYAWMDMTDGNRAIQTSIGAPLIEPHEQWYVDLLVEHRNWLLDDTHIVKGNHGLHQNMGLFVVSSVLNDDVGVNRAIERLGKQVTSVFDDDGLNLEGSIAYHEMNLNWWLQAKQRLDFEGHALPDEAARTLDRAGSTMGTLLLPDGTKPQIGDGGRGRGRKGLHPLIDHVLQGKRPATNLETFHHYANGFTVFRNGWGELRDMKNESHTVVRHGRELARHSHYDRGSIHLYNAGYRWITDAGFHSYQSKNLDRQYTISRQGHSLVDLPNQKHNRAGEVTVELLEYTTTVHSVELLDRNFESAVWKRRVIYLPNFNIWVIWDRIASEFEDEIRQQWLTDVDMEAVKTHVNTIELDAGDRKMQMQWFGSQPDFDIVIGDPEADSKRGLIGVGWKKMRPAASIHTSFTAKNVDSIVVISDPAEGELSVELYDQLRMDSFELLITYQSNSHQLIAKDQETSLKRYL